MTVFGIRHHGPGCARSLIAALDELQPTAILLEGPADATSALALACHPELIPPVSLLIYPKASARHSVSYPLAIFSPEWQVLRWAGDHSTPVHFMDLPMEHRMAMDQQQVTGNQNELEPLRTHHGPELETPLADEQGDFNDTVEMRAGVAEMEVPEENEQQQHAFRADPIALLAEAAGYTDHELWWEEQIERRSDATGLFDAILEAMQSVRAEFPETHERDLLREAFMRKTIRKVRKDTPGPLAVVCGAWHSPVLTEAAIKGMLPGCRIKEDNSLLKGLPKCKTTATWIPWTYSRLSSRSGYGAGIESPGWYAHIWESPANAPLRWLTQGARLLRDNDLSAPTASVIEALRLAETLASLRELRSPGLRELNEAMVTVLCQGDETPLQLIRRQLEIGDQLGTVPAETPTVPLAENLAVLQRTLRLKPAVEQKVLDLDLRKESHRERSLLLHRLTLLGIPWGRWQGAGGGDSTFHEVWVLAWQPEFSVAIIEANVWGNTVEIAATQCILEQARATPDLHRLSELLDVSILADLSSAIGEILQLIHSRSAVSTDVTQLIDAVLPLARIVRYGDVRKTRVDRVLPILESLLERIFVGLLPACSALDDSAAEEMDKRLATMQETMNLLRCEEQQRAWIQQLRKLSRSAVHGCLRGRAVRMLLEQGDLDSEDLDRLTRLELSPVTKTSVAAAWLAGLLKGSGLLLLHQDPLWRILDGWLQRLSAENFIEMLPLLRRAFSGFSGPERRQMGKKLRHLADAPQPVRVSPGTAEQDRVSHERASQVLPVLAEIMGVK